MRTLSLSALLALALAGLAAAQGMKYSERERIVDAARLFSHSYMTGDFATLASLYTEDAVIVPNGGNIIRGRAAIQAYFTPPDDRVITQHVLTAVDLRIEGDTAFDLGTYVIAGKNGDEAWGPSYGNYYVIWQKGADGKWKMTFDMWNRRPNSDFGE